LITGKIYDDISTRPTPQNAVKLYEKLSLMSIREIPLYPPAHREDIDVEVDIIGSNISITYTYRLFYRIIWCKYVDSSGLYNRHHVG
jgi:hypothetical protein